MTVPNMVTRISYFVVFLETLQHGMQHEMGGAGREKSIIRWNGSRKNGLLIFNVIGNNKKPRMAGPGLGRDSWLDFQIEKFLSWLDFQIEKSH